MLTHSSDEKPSLSGNHHHYHQMAFSKHPHVQNMCVYSDPNEDPRGPEERGKETAQVHCPHWALLPAPPSAAYGTNTPTSKLIKTKLFFKRHSRNPRGFSFFFLNLRKVHYV